MSGLLMHCGAHAITRPDLDALPVPPPRGRFHRPTSFGDFVALVNDEMEKHDLVVTEEAHGVTNDGMRYFGLLELKHTRADYATLLGLRSSHDESISKGVAIGSHTFVCDNLCFSGQHVIRTRNTTHVMKRLPGLVSQAIGNLPEEIERQDALMDAMQRTGISVSQAEAFMVELVRREIVAPSRMKRVIDLWDAETATGEADPEYQPKYLDGDAEPTVWTALNVVTEVLKPSDSARPNVLGTIDKTLAISSMIEDNFALAR